MLFEGACFHWCCHHSPLLLLLLLMLLPLGPVRLLPCWQYRAGCFKATHPTALLLLLYAHYPHKDLHGPPDTTAKEQGLFLSARCLA